MSENNPTAVRVYALQEAVKYYGEDGETAEAVIKTAEVFLHFLNGIDLDQGEGETPRVTKPTKPAKPAKVAKPEPKPEPEADETTDKGPTIEEVGKVVKAMLSANLRDPAIELMAKYEAKSVSTLDVKYYAQFIEEANELLLAA